jgi:transcriptional regulator of acetoin/glycerol metabolism
LAGRLHADVAEALSLHDWPQNVRELLQVAGTIEVRAGDESPIRLSHLPPAITDVVRSRFEAGSGRARMPLELLVRQDGVPGRSDLDTALTHYRGNVSRVAAFFDRDRGLVYRWIRKHGLEPESYRES